MVQLGSRLDFSRKRVIQKKAAGAVALNFSRFAPFILVLDKSN